MPALAPVVRPLTPARASEVATPALVRIALSPSSAGSFCPAIVAATPIRLAPLAPELPAAETPVVPTAEAPVVTIAEAVVATAEAVVATTRDPPHFLLIGERFVEGIQSRAEDPHRLQPRIEPFLRRRHPRRGCQRPLTRAGGAQRLHCLERGRPQFVECRSL